MKNLPFRIGHGYDLHRLEADRKLVLGGIHIPHEKGLAGHSDADCLLHALADAIFGALGLPDIGYHFPDHDPKNKDLDSMIILERSVAVCKDAGYIIGNVDIVILAEEPKMSPHLDKIRESLGATLETTADRIGLKATTNEGLGEVGRKEAIAAHAVCLLVHEENGTNY